MNLDFMTPVSFRMRWHLALVALAFSCLFAHGCSQRSAGTDVPVADAVPVESTPPVSDGEAAEPGNQSESESAVAAVDGGIEDAANSEAAPDSRAHEESQGPPPAPDIAVVPPPNPIRIALYDAPGVSGESLRKTRRLLASAEGFDPVVVTPEQVRSSALSGMHVVLFTGGRGSVQGRLLGEAGRQAVRDFLASGGGYIGVCAGSYLAIQGREEFHKIELVAARHLSGDYWRRGIATVRVREVGGSGVHRLFYANGPIFERIRVRGLDSYQPLATYLSDVYLTAQGTQPGEMPGTPAILAASYRGGRIILFSPNPVLAAEDERTRPDIMLDAIRWVATRGSVPRGLVFTDVFHGER